MTTSFPAAAAIEAEQLFRVTHAKIVEGRNCDPVALLRAVKALDNLQMANQDQKVGIEIVRRAIEAPVRQIAENAGAEGSVIVGKLREKTDFSFGWNAQTGEYGDLYAQGVIDPAKVVRTALQDAASVAGLLVTTEAMIAEKPKKDAAPALPAGAGMDF